MTIKIDRRKIESICIFISLTLVVILAFLGILALADGILNWDILPPKLEKIAFLFMGICAIVILASFLICLMVNFSLLAINLEKIANKICSNENE